MKYILIISGSISLFLGVVAAFVPLLPTTPFLILSLYCYLKSSKRLYEWLLGHRIFGRYLYNYVTYRAIEKKTKIYTIVFFWISLIVSMLLFMNLYICILLTLIGIAVSIHVGSLKTIEKQKKQ